MKIHSNIQTERISTVQGASSTSPGRKSAAAAASGGPSVDLSAEGQMIQSLKNAVDLAPAVREDKVAALRSQIQNGTYQVDTEKLAGILSKVLADG